MFSVISTLGLFRVATMLYGANGYWFDTLSDDARVRALQARIVTCATYFRAAQRDVLKGVDFTELIVRRHDETVARDRAVRRNAFPLLRIHSDYSDMHDIPWGARRRRRCLR